MSPLISKANLSRVFVRPSGKCGQDRQDRVGVLLFFSGFRSSGDDCWSSSRPTRTDLGALADVFGGLKHGAVVRQREVR